MIHLKLPNEKGQGFVEYALIFVGVILLVLLSLKAFGISVQEVYCNISGDLGGEGCGCQNSFTGAAELNDWENYGKEDDIQFINDQICLTGGKPILNACSQDFGKSGFTASLNNITLNAPGKSKAGFDFLFRTQDDKNGYLFTYNSKKNTIAFIKEVKGKWVVLSSSSVPTSWVGQEMDLQIKVNGNTFTAVVDGESILQAKDDAYENGQYGLEVKSTSQLCIDELIVQPNP